METAKEGREWVNIKEIKELGLREMRARKEDQEQASLGYRVLERGREGEEEEETTEEYTPYVVPDHIALFNQRVEEALRPPVLNWG